MACIDRELLVNFDQPSAFVVYFLRESKSSLVAINLFHVASAPALMAGNIETVAPAAIG
jgi:hypothetical protein